MLQQAKVTATSPLTVALKTSPASPTPAQRIGSSVPPLAVGDDVLVEVLDRRLIVLHRIGAIDVTPVGGIVTKVKATDESVTSSTSSVHDAELRFPALAGEAWVVDARLFVVGAAAGDIRCGVASTGGATVSALWAAHGPATTLAADEGDASMVGATEANTKFLGVRSTTVPVLILVSAHVTVTVAGTVSVRWAQAVSDVTPTTVKAGSWLTARKVAQA